MRLGDFFRAVIFFPHQPGANRDQEQTVSRRTANRDMQQPPSEISSDLPFDL